ncbi:MULTISPECIES: hypothetical protein [Paenibacillus]|uniref:Uncharacterized protein n=1 Tax=Paenibacillus albilobatus TaxID=2716884 RepID=A0A919XGR8_9BACL|nr:MULTISPECIES: hypothetical protein [Paenibacillus]GIO31891.1 hypothetical protein J2TS6_30320 [Paenibacillus albilobatus]
MAEASSRGDVSPDFLPFPKGYSAEACILQSLYMFHQGAGQVEKSANEKKASLGARLFTALFG